ncbi:hypothetical protein FACS1894190_17740 [Spirochaetia bacterium]|nr:hypothetical protein FACS1894190_17740 [Spirochaetia bacterium]
MNEKQFTVIAWAIFIVVLGGVFTGGLIIGANRGRGAERGKLESEVARSVGLGEQLDRERQQRSADDLQLKSILEHSINGVGGTPERLREIAKAVKILEDRLGNNSGANGNSDNSGNSDGGS